MVTISDLTISRCTKKNLKAVIEFSQRMKKQGISFLPQGEKEFLNKYRKYAENTEELNLFTLQHKGEGILGCTGYVLFKGMLKGKEIKGFIGSDAVIDSQYRSRYSLLAAALARSYEKLVRSDKLFPLVCPAGKMVLKAFKSVQWRTFAYIYRFSHPLAAQIVSDLKTASIELKRISYFAKDINLFFKRISSQHYFLLNTDIDFLNWKYFRNPYSEYVVLMAIKGKEIIGYIIAEQKGVNIYIVDITVDLKYPRAIFLLLSEVFTYCEKLKISTTVLCLSHRRYIEILTKIGFASSWGTECLFLKAGLVFSKINLEDFYSGDKNNYHFNGFVPHLY